MLRNRMRELLDRTEPALGAWTNLSDPSVVEIMGIAGLDYTFIDTEHNGLDLEGLKNHLRAARAFGLGNMVRVYTPEEKFVLRVLDSGAEGILAPHCATPDDARYAVNAVRYPPEGNRGYTMNSRGADYGGHGAGSNTEMAEHVNRLLVCGIYVEDIAAVECIEDIVSVPGIDFCQIGPGDLSASMGLTGTVNHPDVVAAVDRIRAACKAAGVGVGMTVEHPSLSLSYEVLKTQGYTALIAGNDSGMLLKGFQNRVNSIRGSAGKGA
ncbi:MAG: HpcH/HpaI aldolase family protein [Candidatus Dormibacteraceae bacterium]|nr:aldolase/citrate lyase family protein [Candidatus Acidoferrales bacterium]